ncbi:hypothetical protein TorRG33x02_324350 [Trema orientale]|uniref:Uncharacterized protein n=1 Tax=Trema orientale TaxID=63057 RepID=A0A2P5BE40_TREOI|nr:hypothetical protein TorRG33x02_324350 [Trema orientale]
MTGIDSSDGIGKVVKLAREVRTEMKTSPRGVSSFRESSRRPSFRDQSVAKQTESSSLPRWIGFVSDESGLEP